MKNVFRSLKNNASVQRHLRRWWLVLREFQTKDISYKAASLSYSLLFSIVPLSALVFAIARGFGLDEYIIHQIKTFFAYEPQVGELFLTYINKYLLRAQSGIFIGFGVLLLLYTFSKLLYDIEDVFNQIWHVRTERSIKRKLANYMCAVVYIPLFLILSSGVSIFFSTSLPQLLPPDSLFFALPLGWIIPYVLMILLLCSIYMLIPNTKVPFRVAIGAAIPVGIGVQLVIYAYIHMQILVTTYNAVYGSLAAVPITMLIVLFMWYLILLGATWSYVYCNEEGLENDPKKMTRLTYHYMMLELLRCVLENFDQEARGTSMQELEQLLGHKSAFVGNFVDDLQAAGLIHEVERCYYPSVAPAHCTVAFYLERIVETGKSLPLKDFAYTNFVHEIFELDYAEQRIIELQLEKGKKKKEEGQVPIN